MNNNIPLINGAPYMFSFNLNLKDSLISGKLGILKKVSSGYLIWLEFENWSVGFKQRLKFRKMLIKLKIEDKNWTPIQRSDIMQLS